MSDAGTARHVPGKDEPILVAGAPGEVVADDARDVRYASIQGPLPGLVAGFGPLVDTPPPDGDGVADEDGRAP